MSAQVNHWKLGLFVLLGIAASAYLLIGPLFGFLVALRQIRNGIAGRFHVAGGQ